MKKLNSILIPLFSVLAFSANAAGPRAVAQTNLKKGCASCTANEKLTVQFKALAYKNSVDQEKGSQLMLPVMARLEDSKIAMKTSANQKQKIFDSLLDLLVVSAPYDFESQGAQLLSDVLQADGQLRTRFDSKMSPQNLSCEQKLLKSSILEFRCDSAKKASGPEGDASCIQTFNYDACLDTLKSSK